MQGRAWDPWVQQLKKLAKGVVRSVLSAKEWWVTPSHSLAIIGSLGLLLRVELQIEQYYMTKCLKLVIFMVFFTILYSFLQIFFLFYINIRPYINFYSINHVYFSPIEISLNNLWL